MLTDALLTNSVTNPVFHGTGSTITNNLTTGTAFTQIIAPTSTSSAGITPKAFLNVVFFDERFNFVQEGSIAARTTKVNLGSTLALLNIKVPKNGYCLVYISNESAESVYFDDLKVRHDRGRILEENHYYAYGLKIAALSSRAFGGLPNAYQYQGDYSEFDDDLGWNDFMLRSYDPQIGRFLQHDPYDQFASGYVGMGNDPGNGTDPSGGLFGIGGGVGCAATAGMSGYGGFAGRIAGGLNMGGVLSTAVAMGGIAVKGASLSNSVSSIGNSIGASGSQGLSQSAYSGASGPNAGSGDDGGAAPSSGWQPLDKETLYQYLEKQGCNCDEDALHRAVGEYFERVWDLFGQVNLTEYNYKPNPNIPFGGSNLKPDGMSNTKAEDRFWSGLTRKPRVYPNAAWYEVKARSNGIYMSTDEGQIQKYIGAVAALNPVATLDNASALNLVTTSNMTISYALRLEAFNIRVQFHHIVSYYKVNKAGQYIIKFTIRTSRGDIDVDKIPYRPVIVSPQAIIKKYCNCK
jgi:RHS repeat-associated protein